MKGKILNKRSLFSSLIVAATFLLACVTASAQNARKVEPELEKAPNFVGLRYFNLTGTWLVTITPDDGSPSFVGYYSFFGDGNASFSSAGPPIPALGNPGYGVWKPIARNQFAATIRMNSYDLAFQFAGTLKINARIQMTGPDSFTTTDSVTVYDPLGNEIVVLGGSAQGTRIKVEH